MDGSFENAENDKNWTIAGTGASITEDSGNAADGKRALKFWHPMPTVSPPRRPSPDSSLANTC